MIPSLLPVGMKDLVFVLGQTCVLQTPLDKLLPSKKGHVGPANHDLIEIVGQGGATDVVVSNKQVG